MTRTTISFPREDMELLRKAAKRQGSSVSQFVREAALMRARMASDKNPYPMRDLAEQLRKIGDQGPCQDKIVPHQLTVSTQRREPPAGMAGGA
jgi:hypothetical protein